MSKKELDDLISQLDDLLVEFDEMGYCPTSLCFNSEEVAMNWKSRLVFVTSQILSYLPRSKK